MDPNSHESPAGQRPTQINRWLWLFLAAGAVVMFIAILLPHGRQKNSTPADSLNNSGRHTEGASDSPTGTSPNARRFERRAHPSSDAELKADEIVAAKVQKFGRSRREIVRAIARRLQKEVPAEVERFFDAVEANQWEEVDRQWNELAKRSGQFGDSTKLWEELSPYWSAVHDAYGAAEQAHDWPAQELLDYGKSILDSLRPGMVYVGGTDNGRWIPELLNEGSDSEHMMITQNAMADGRYLEWINTLYGDRMTMLTTEESQGAFQAYVADATRRLQHDQQFPDEPKQIRPGEDVKIIDGKVQISGQASVMGINERLLQMLMEKNPDLSFAIQESFPLRSTYANALPLGPIMELNAKDGPKAFTPERAAQSVDLWRNRADQLSGPGSTPSDNALKSYSHDAVATANLLAARDFSAEAEQLYRLSSQIWPANPESTAALAGLLTRTGREGEATQLLADFARQYPGQLKKLEEVKGRFSVTADIR